MAMKHIVLSTFEEFLHEVTDFIVYVGSFTNKETADENLQNMNYDFPLSK